MKHRFGTGLLVALGLAVAAVTPVAAQQPSKIAYINSERILAQAPGSGEAMRALEADMAKYRAEVDSLEAALMRAQEEYRKQQSTLSEAARQTRQQALQQQFQQYQQRTGELEELAQRRRAELVQPIMQRISAVIEDIRKEGSYAIIFDAAAGGMITADPALDLTDRVLERLKSAPANGQ